MASALYAPFKKLLLDGDIDLLTDTIKAVLVDAGDYTFDSAHNYLDDIAAGARIATSSALSNKSTTDGVFDADDVTFTAVTGDEWEAIVLYKDTGTEGTSPLICYIDTGTGFPMTPTGSDITAVWSNGSSRIFAL